MYKCLYLLLLLLSVNQLAAQPDFTKYADPFIGTGGHGHTYPGAVLPHGMVQLSPDTRLSGWDGCGGYHYSDSFIYGFTHTHLSGTGCSDYGDVLLMPMSGKPSPDNKVYGSAFSHATEKASPGYYEVQLQDDNILVRLTATERVGFHQYTFSNDDPAAIILDLQHRDEVLASSLRVVNGNTVTGLRRSKAWATNQYVYFAIQFSVDFSQYGIWQNDTLLPHKLSKVDNSKNLKAFFQFDQLSKRLVMAKVAISGVSEAGALKNLKAELPGWDFEAVRQAAQKKWAAELGKIEVTGGSPQQLRNFYTALYHTAVVPCINMDVDGRYRGRDNAIHTAKGFTNYSVFSLWDTYRAAHPLYTIIDRKRTLDYIQSFLTQYKEGGRLPVWELSGCETDCMIGYHSVPVIVDAYVKGIKGFDAALALEAMQKSATWNHLGLPALMDHGYVEKDDEHESVSKTLEYAYDDWCIAQMARLQGKENVYQTFARRSQSWKNLLDTETGFMRPRKNGGWLTPFDPYEVNNNFTEGNSWQYAFYVPHDMYHYIEMLGGPAKLEQRLDSLFGTTSRMTGLELPDITGLIGQYAHGNEPSHHIAYLYNFAGNPGKAQKILRYIMDSLYSDTPDGLTGNEDCGQMSAWYVLSAMGFYPVTPGTTDYITGSPLFPAVRIHLENGKSFTIEAEGAGVGNCYVQSMQFNGKPYEQSWFSHTDLAKGGKLQFQMDNRPASFGTRNPPVTKLAAAPIVTSPVITADEPAFKKSTAVRINSAQKDAQYYFTTDGTAPGVFAQKYEGPFVIDKTVTIRAVAINRADRSGEARALLYKAPNDWSIQLQTPCERQYAGGGNEALIDGVRGSVNWRKGNWQGWQKADMAVVIDLQQVRAVKKVTIGFLQDVGAWIVLPGEVLVETSADGKNYIAYAAGKDFLPVEDKQPQVKNIAFVKSGVQTRYIRITARQYGKLPAWHEGAGGDTHIFCDEIMVE